MCALYYLFSWVPDIIYKSFVIKLRPVLSSHRDILYCFWQVVKGSNNLGSSQCNFRNWDCKLGFSHCKGLLHFRFTTTPSLYLFYSKRKSDIEWRGSQFKGFYHRSLLLIDPTLQYFGKTQEPKLNILSFRKGFFFFSWDPASNSD